MLLFFLKRLLQAIPVLFAVATMTFFAVRLAPGGPFDSEKKVPPEVLKNLQEKYHLNDPLHHQYFSYLKQVLSGDLGPSFKYPGRTVNEIIEAGFPISLELGFYALVIGLTLGLFVGLFAALRHNRWLDHFLMSSAMLGICIPSFVMGPLLVLVFGIHFEWVSVSGWDSASDKVLPSITLGLGLAAYIARLTRSGMLEVLSQDYIRTAKAKGVSEFQIIFKHAIRGALAPVLSYLGPAVAGLLAGTFVIETIFDIPGLGRFFVQGAFNRDYTMVLGTVLFDSVLIIFFNFLVDLGLVVLDPRLGFQGKSV